MLLIQAIGVSCVLDLPKINTHRAHSGFSPFVRPSRYEPIRSLKYPNPPRPPKVSRFTRCLGFALTVKTVTATVVYCCLERSAHLASLGPYDPLSLRACWFPAASPGCGFPLRPVRPQLREHCRAQRERVFSQVSQVHPGRGVAASELQAALRGAGGGRSGCTAQAAGQGLLKNGVL